MIPHIMLGIMATPQKVAKASDAEFENHLRKKRQASGLSQKQLAAMAGMTRQAVGAIEANQYSPATSVALQLARALKCRVEDLFSIKTGGDILEGELLGSLPEGAGNKRVQVTQVGDRLLVRPLDGAGELTSLASGADGLIVVGDGKKKRVTVKLLKYRSTIQRQVVIAGCDPGMFLAGQQLRQGDRIDLVPCLMGNALALDALKRGEVHVAGVHSDNGQTDFKRKLEGLDCIVVTFAHWQEGLIVGRGNPKRIRDFEDLANVKVRIINREKGSGARRLLDGQLKKAGIQPGRVRGYGDEVFSHLEIAGRVKAGLADAGVGIRAAAAIYGLDFVALQRERYDLIIPKKFYETLAGLKALLDIIVSRRFRDELEALGGYDTKDTGNIVEMHARSTSTSA
jgi:molybdopterin molybdotransferase/putative molybdopterin biosynthesis protein